MDDSCAVCCDSLEWVAYGACGHKDVCSTCVARLRNICHDLRCCICKTECDVVFITKAMGDYTKNIDFSSLPVGAREGRAGPYWHHEATQAFFDDKDHYQMIKAMCTFSCGVCDKLEDDAISGRKNGFRSLHQLKGHLFHRHKLFLCKLCLEGRKVFICEQKLFTKAQLNRHINTGDSDVDGDESERGGFMGHPICGFCQTPFYGDNELYMHNSTEHYTCHLCQRQNPGHYEYFKNYDDLEIHFRQDHHICEHEDCLAKKFVVFISEEELKRHNAMEHGGRMSRSQRNAALQIPVRFRYRRSNEGGHQRGRGGRSFHRESNSDDQLTRAIQASLETANLDSDFPIPSASSAAQQHTDIIDASSIDPSVPMFDTVATSDAGPTPSRYLQAVSHHYGSVPVEQSSFPPLSSMSSSSQQKTQQEAESNSMAARLRQKNKVNVNVAQSRSGTSQRPSLPSTNGIQTWPRLDSMSASSSSGRGQTNLSTAGGSNVSVAQGHPVSSYRQSLPSTNVTQTWPNLSTSSSSDHGQTNLSAAAGSASSSYVSSLHSRSPGLVGSSGLTKQPGNSSDGRMNHSASASSLSERSGSLDPVSNFPPISQAQRPSSNHNGSASNAGDMQNKNKSLVDKIRAGLGHDLDKYAAFKEISQEYRQDLIDTWSYLHYVEQFGLSHLVPELANLCPDPQKRKGLLEAYDVSLQQKNGPQETFWGEGNIRVKERKNNSKSAKGKNFDTGNSSGSSKNAVADNFLDTVRRLQSDLQSNGDTETLDKDGYRGISSNNVRKPESRVVADESYGILLSKGKGDQSGDDGSSSGKPSLGDGGKGSKKGKKLPKFQRVRLGDVAALRDLDNSANEPDCDHQVNEPGHNSSNGLPVRGVWGRGGGQKLFGTSKK